MSTPDKTPERTIDVEGRRAIDEVVENERQQQVAENAEGESTRRRLLAAKRKREEEAESFEHTFTEAESPEVDLDSLFVGETFEFRPFPKELKNAFEEASLKFAGSDEEDPSSEQAQRMDEVNERILDALAHYSVDPELDLPFWSEMTDMEDRQVMAGQLIATQGK